MTTFSLQVSFKPEASEVTGDLSGSKASLNRHRGDWRKVVRMRTTCARLPGFEVSYLVSLSGVPSTNHPYSFQVLEHLRPLFSGSYV